MDNIHLNERSSSNASLNGSAGVDGGRRISNRAHSMLEAVGGHVNLPNIVTVVVRKDENGYGMKVSGDKPVYVQNVRDGGAADKAGLHAGDTILKVNGVDVFKFTHSDVVALIRSSTYVNLTVKQRILRTPVGSPSITLHHSTGRPLSHQHLSTSTRITAPQPVDHDKLREFENERVITIRKMLEKEQSHVESLRSELAAQSSSDSTKIDAEIARTERTVKKLQSELQAQLIALAAHNNDLSTSPFSHTLPKTLTSSSPQPSLPQSKSFTQMLTVSPPPIPDRTSSARVHSLNSANLHKTDSAARKCLPQDWRAGGDASSAAASTPPSPHLIQQRPQKDVPPTPPKSDKTIPDILKFDYFLPRKSLHKVAPKANHVAASKTPPKSRARFYDNDSYVDTDDGDSEATLPPPLPPRVTVGDVPAPVSFVSTSGTVDPDAVNSINKQMSYPLVATCAALFNNPCNPKAPHIVNTHHRTKSSPDPLTLNTSQDASNRLIASESMNDLSDIRATRCDSWEIMEPSGHITPPGTPPPPYPSPYRGRSPNTSVRSLSAGGGSHRSSGDQSDEAHDELTHAFPIHPLDASTLSCGDVVATGVVTNSPIMAANSNVIQQPIMTMEDELSDQELEQIEDGPFRSFTALLPHAAHLAVFFNYILTNCDPSSILFYLITELYKEGNAKDMKKWAYEIHSSFLVPGSPLRLNNVDENIAREIDDVLLVDADKEEKMRQVFLKARAKAKEELNELVSEFKQKRNAGLGTLYGPPDAILDETFHDKPKENKIVEDILIKKLDPYLEDIDREPVDHRRYTTAVALSTVFSRYFGLRQIHADLERFPTYVNRDKSLKTKIIGRSRKMNVRGHQFVAHQYYTVTYCNNINCQLLIWGIGPQAYQCSNCLSNVHRHCAKNFEETCPGPLVKKERGGDPISKFMDRIRSDTKSETKRKPSSSSFLQVEREKRHMEERDQLGDMESSIERPSSASITRSGSDRRSDASEDTPEPDSRDKESTHENFHRIPRPKSSQNSINRSESYKEQTQKRRQIRERRKISDPNLSKSNDVEHDISGLSYQTNSGSSSNSSLSSGRSLESPSTSLETVPMAVGATAHARILDDSDAETEKLDACDWASGVSEEVLANLSACEKKRQEVFNELYNTERSHVRQLRVIETVFQIPLVKSNLLSTEQITLLFPNLDRMIELHFAFSTAMKALRQDNNPLVGEVGDTLLTMFDGPAGESFEKAAGEFCARQQIALEWLRERRRKDAKLHTFLKECEADKVCRRLQLKDLIPTGMLRLTKYPLLFENLVKYTTQCLADANTTNLTPQEYEKVNRALERSKEILNRANAAVRETEDFTRLQNIQRRLDRSAFDKIDHPIVAEFRNLDITKHRLIYEGPLYWRITHRQRISLHVVLVEDIIILLQKQDEKYTLKFHHTSTPAGTDRYLSPIIRVSTVIVRTNATDSNSLYLLTTEQTRAQMYDLVASSSGEINKWFKHISEATDAYKKNENRYGRNSSDNSDSELVTDNDSLHRESLQTNDDNSTTSVGTSADSDNISLKIIEDGVSIADKPAPQTEDNTSIHSSDSMTSAGNPVAHVAHSPLILSTEQCALIEPSEVHVSTKPVLTAEPILTPIEQLRRKDCLIREALNEKQQLVADLLSVPKDDFEHIAELASEPYNDKDATELVLAAFSQANQLTQVINDALNVNEETAIALTATGCAGATSRLCRLPGVQTPKLQSISSSLNVQLTQLLRVIKERDEEREKLRQELQKSREQIHILHELNRLKAAEPAESEIVAESTAEGNDETLEGGHEQCTESRPIIISDNAETQPSEEVLNLEESYT